MSRNREPLLEDSFNRPDGKSFFHANAVLAQSSREVQNPPRRAFPRRGCALINEKAFPSQDGTGGQVTKLWEETF